MRRCRNNTGAGVCFAAFGVGLLACCVLPTKCIVVLLGAALVCCGLSCTKR
ncbi:MAG: hypothetical protein II363_04180 [Clostridia bacterium]|nr:hypothetical protein [Clostridia bacterium]